LLTSLIEACCTPVQILNDRSENGCSTHCQLTQPASTTALTLPKQYRGGCRRPAPVSVSWLAMAPLLALSRLLPTPSPCTSVEVHHALHGATICHLCNLQHIPQRCHNQTQLRSCLGQHRRPLHPHGRHRYSSNPSEAPWAIAQSCSCSATSAPAHQRAAPRLSQVLRTCSASAVLRTT